MSVRRIAVIGAGNVGWHLVKRLLESSCHVMLFAGKSQQVSNHFNAFNIPVHYELSSIGSADLALLCTPDDSIAHLISDLPDSLPLAYTSGTVNLDQLPPHPDLGVFYPLQSFTKGLDLQSKSFPLLLEARSDKVLLLLKELAALLQLPFSIANSEQRKQIHLSAVLANNFTNQLWKRSFELLEAKHLDPQLLLPLMEESVAKLKRMTPKDAQTGPARRGDLQTIRTHLNMLENSDQALYLFFSNLILDQFHPDHEKL